MTILCSIKRKRFIQMLLPLNGQYQNIGMLAKNEISLMRLLDLSRQQETLYNQYALIHLYQLPLLKT